MSSVQFQRDDPSAPPPFTKVSTDLVGDEHLQRVKLDVGAAGASSPVTAANPLPIAGTVTGPLTDAQLRASNVPIAIGDGANLDAFSRLRVSQPQGIFDQQFTYNDGPLQFEKIISGSGAAIAHDATNRCVTHTFDNTPANGLAVMQSFEWIRYQPGRSQAAFVTFNFIESKANVVKFAGLGDGNNGIEFRLNGSTKQWAILSDTNEGDEIVSQANWNLDKLDGNGASGLTLNIAATQIAVIDFQALYVGRVRVGFDIGGCLVYAHEFNHANLVAFPYIQTASLPVRCGMSCSNTASTTMRFICSSVISEGGQEENGGVPVVAEGTATAGNGTDVHILSIRPKTTFNGITNRIKIVPDSVEVLVTGNNPVLWKLVIGQAITGTTTFSNVNATYSCMEFNTLGTANNAPAIVLQQGYIASSAQARGVANPRTVSKIPITLDAAGAVRANGTLSVLVQGIGATSACRASINWRELR
jgi:hypothetical protein